MLKSQELAIEINKRQVEINTLPFEMRSDDPQLQTRIAEREVIQKKLIDLQKQRGAALESEAKRIEGAEFTAESAELRELVSKANAAQIVAAVANRTVIDGATAELQREARVGADVVPWALLEKRAAATFTANTGEADIGRYIAKAYADSIAAFVGCAVVQVPVGAQDWPILSTGAAVEHQTASAAVAETTAAFTVEKLTPRNRYQASFAVREQDLIVFSEAGAALSNDLRAATMDALDKDLITRANEGIDTTKTGAAPTPPGAASTAAAMIGYLFAAVDGILASDAAQVRMVVGGGATGTYQYMGATASGTGGDASVAEKIAQVSGGIRVSPHIPAYTGNHQDGFVAKMGAAPNAAMALFGGGVRILEDPFSRAAEAERRFHGILFGDFTVLRTDAYDRFAVRTS